MKSRKDIEEKFAEEMQIVYGKMLNFVGTEFGDIEPLQLVELEEAENKLNHVVTNWLLSGMEVTDES